LSDGRRLKKSSGSHREAKTRKKMTGRRRDESSRARSPQNSPSLYDADESNLEELPSGYHQVSIQVGSIVSSWHEERSGGCATLLNLDGVESVEFSVNNILY
jgi:hypothetical protein